jgi:alkyl hydroperoxide reductase subunit AhpC
MISSMIGRDWVLLFIQPSDLRASLDPMAGRNKEFAERKCKCIRVSHGDKPKPKSAVLGEQSLHIGDPDRKIARRYDVPLAGEGSAPNGPTTIRSVFIIGPDKRIKLSLSYPRGTGQNFDEILRHIDLMQLLEKDRVEVARQTVRATRASKEVRITWATTDGRYQKKVVFSEAALNELSKFSEVGRSDLASIVAAVESMLLNDKDAPAHRRFPEEVGVKDRFKRLESCCRRLLDILKDNKTIRNMRMFEFIRFSKTQSETPGKSRKISASKLAAKQKRHNLELTKLCNQIEEEFNAVARLHRRAIDIPEKPEWLPKMQSDKRNPVDRRKIAIAECAVYIWIFPLGRKKTLTDKFIGFTDYLYRLADFGLKSPAIRAQLTSVIKSLKRDGV